MTRDSGFVSGSTKKIRVLLADEHLMVRDALRRLLDAQADIEVVAAVGNGCAAVSHAEQHQPDVVVMEVCLPLLGGPQFVRQIRARAPSAKLLVLSALESRWHLRALLAAGISGYVLKGSSPGELLWAVRRVVRGEVYFAAQFSGLKNEDANLEAARSVGSPMSGLMDGMNQDICVLWYVAHGYTMKEIAPKFSLTVKTIETYKAQAMRKLDLGSRADIVRYAVQNGWFENQGANR